MSNPSGLVHLYLGHWGHYAERHLQRCWNAWGAAERGEYGAKQIVAYCAQTSRDVVDAMRRLPAPWDPGEPKKTVRSIAQGTVQSRVYFILPPEVQPQFPLQVILTGAPPAVSASSVDLADGEAGQVALVTVQNLGAVAAGTVIFGLIKDQGGRDIVEFELKVE